jgi:hypothetical protein
MASGAVGADVLLRPRAPTLPAQARGDGFSSAFSPFLKKYPGESALGYHLAFSLSLQNVSGKEAGEVG